MLTDNFSLFLFYDPPGHFHSPIRITMVLGLPYSFSTQLALTLIIFKQIDMDAGADKDKLVE